MNKKINEENEEMNIKTVTYKQEKEIAIERFEKEKRRKENDQLNKNKIENKVANIVIEIKLFIKDNQLLPKMKTKLEEMNESITKEHTNNI